MSQWKSRRVNVKVGQDFRFGSNFAKMPPKGKNLGLSSINLLFILAYRVNWRGAKSEIPRYALTAIQIAMIQAFCPPVYKQLSSNSLLFKKPFRNLVICPRKMLKLSVVRQQRSCQLPFCNVLPELPACQTAWQWYDSDMTVPPTKLWHTVR